MTAGKQFRQTIIQEISEKAKKYCAYSERCTFDVKQKLTGLGADENTCQKIIKCLKQEGYIDDERFAMIFAKSKFNNNSWGKVKIRSELRKRGIKESTIEKAVEEIDKKAYFDHLKMIYQKKVRELKIKNKEHIKEKATAYCLQKGFEADLVFSVNSER